MLRSIFRFFISRDLWIFLGLLAVAFLIWVIGPVIAVGRYRPLESEFVRIAVIALMFAIWIVRLVYRKWRERRLNAQLLNQLRVPSRKEKEARPEDAPEIKELQSGFTDATAILKNMRFGQGADGKPASRFSVFDRQYLYQLPWYIFIGAPGSGKTTALVNSDLDFPLADQLGKAAVRGIGGTRNCDWWFTNEAVLIDTAGRYTTHESNRETDEGEWKGFLDLLKKFRPRQPINGAILTISIADLPLADDAQRARHAMALRKRLLELRNDLGIDFPVYVLVTKTDLLAGFNEYFGSLGRAERAQVWGFHLSHRGPFGGRREGRPARALPPGIQAPAPAPGRTPARADGRRARPDAPRAGLPAAPAVRELRGHPGHLPGRRVQPFEVRGRLDAAGRLLHQRHAGRHGLRPRDGRDQALPAGQRAAGAAAGSGQELLPEGAAAAGDLPRRGRGRHQPALVPPPPRHRHGGLQPRRRAAGGAAGRLREQLAPQQGLRGRGRQQRQGLQQGRGARRAADGGRCERRPREFVADPGPPARPAQVGPVRHRRSARVATASASTRARSCRPRPTASTSARSKACCCRRRRSASSSRCAMPRRSMPSTATRR
jgi:hypothetical protein